jgi:hypothetical protein
MTHRVGSPQKILAAQHERRAAIPKLDPLLDHLVGARQCELKHCASRLFGICPQPARMSIDDGPANGEPHPHAGGFRGVEGIENAIEKFWINPRRLGYLSLLHCSAAPTSDRMRRSTVYCMRLKVAYRTRYCSGSYRRLLICCGTETVPFSGAVRGDGNHTPNAYAVIRTAAAT